MGKGGTVYVGTLYWSHIPTIYPPPLDLPLNYVTSEG